MVLEPGKGDVIWGGGVIRARVKPRDSRGPKRAGAGGFWLSHIAFTYLLQGLLEFAAIQSLAQLSQLLRGNNFPPNFPPNFRLIFRLI